MNRTANVSALGYAAFALTLWMNSMIPAGWFNADEGSGVAVATAVVLGGCVMAIAGIVQCLRGRTLDTLVFLGFSGYWWIVTLVSEHVVNASPTPGYLGWYYIVWAFLAFCIWLAACKDGVARMLFTLGLTVSLLAFALNGWTRIGALAELGGYLGLVTAIVGIYIAAAEVINELHGHAVLPLGETSPEGNQGHPEASNR